MAVHYQIRGRGADEISTSVEVGVRRGQLTAGTALPPVRRLAEQLGVAPATVAAAYKRLRERGIVETAGRNGTRVRAAPPIARRGEPAVPAPPGTIDLSRGEPDPALLPALGPFLSQLAGGIGAPVSYATCGPWPEFVTLARDRFAADGVPMTEAALTVTSGALDALERLLAAQLRPGDRVGIEDPGWANLIDLVAALGLHAVPMPVDDEGPTVDGLERTLAAGAAAVVVTSRAQNPTGAALSEARATALRVRLRRYPDVLAIEDDHAGELAAPPLHPLVGEGRRWAFLRSVSKPYGPDLRVAALAGDEQTIARVEGRMRLGAGWVSTLLQRLVVLLWRDEGVAAMLRRAGSEYDRRRAALLAALAEHGVPAHGHTGLNVWVPVPDEATAIAALRDQGWAVGAGSRHRLEAPPGLRITLGAPAARAGALAAAVAAAISPAVAGGRR